MYLMTSFMGILSMEPRWRLAIEAEGFSYDRFADEFFRFIVPALSAGGGSRDIGDLTEPKERKGS
jgi:hypothetical protein